jgi:Aspartyl protease
MRQVPLVIEPDPDDPGCAAVMVDGTVAGRPYRFLLDTGAARTQLETDEYTTALRTVTGDTSYGSFGIGSADSLVTIADLAVGPLQAATLEVTRDECGPHMRNHATVEHPMDLILGYPTLRQADWLFDFPAKRWALTN